MRKLLLAATLALAPAPAFAQAAMHEMMQWGVAVSELEWRKSRDAEALAWNLRAFAGFDEGKLELLSSGERGLQSGAGFDALETQLLWRFPVGDFFDAYLGARYDAPEGEKRPYGVIGLSGLAKQWLEVSAEAHLGETPALRFGVEYEGLITNRLILTPEINLEIPLRDDDALGVGAFGAMLETGARLSYDLHDRMLSPYIGLHYERAFGGTADRRRADGEAVDALSGVVGVKIMF